MPAHPGLHLTRTEENVEEIDALARLLGGRVGLETMLGDLDRQGRRGLAPGLKVHRSFTFDAADRRDERWWPQGISTSADASETETIGGKRIVAVAWYAKKLPGDACGNHGSRITFFDLDTRRYRHVLLVVPKIEDGRLVLAPLRAHAGGIVWSGPYLHVAATAKGFHTCRLDDLLRIPDDLAGPTSGIGIEDDRVSSHGYRYVLPVRFSYSAAADEGEERLRYSFMSLDRETTPPSLVVGEYARGKQTRRLVRFALDPETHLLSTADDNLARPVLLGDGVRRMQGAVMARGRLHVTTSEGPWGLGSLYAGAPGDLRQLRWATPMGPEDITYWPSTDLLWSVSEHPRRRWLYAVRRASLS